MFLGKLLALLQPRKLPARFNVIPFLTVMDPESDMKVTVSRPLLYPDSPKLIPVVQASTYIVNAKNRMPPGILLYPLSEY